MPLSYKYKPLCFKYSLSCNITIITADNERSRRILEQLTVFTPSQEVKCAKGYSLVGEEVTCLIQNVYTNADTDARLVKFLLLRKVILHQHGLFNGDFIQTYNLRLLPACVLNAGEALVGNGAAYAGTKSTFTSKGVTTDCDNWNKDVMKGTRSRAFYDFL